MHIEKEKKRSRQLQEGRGQKFKGLKRGEIQKMGKREKERVRKRKQRDSCRDWGFKD